MQALQGKCFTQPDEAVLAFPHDLTCSNQNSPLHCGWLVLASRDDASELSCVKTLPKKIKNSEKGVTMIIRLWRWKSSKIPTACFSTVTRKKPAYIQMSKLSCSVLDVFVGMLVPQKRLELKTPFFIIVTLTLSKHLTFIQPWLVTCMLFQRRLYVVAECRISKIL